MNNNNVASQTQSQPGWLKRIMEDSEHEGAMHAYTGSRMLQQKARRIVWHICEQWNCCTNGVPGQACRIVEWFIVSTVKSVHTQGRLDMALRKQILEYYWPRMLLVVSSSILIAVEVNSMRSIVTAQGALLYLASEGFIYNLEDFYTMELKILNNLERHVYPTSSVQLGEMLAYKLGVESYVISRVAEILNLAEKYLFDIEIALNSAEFIRLQRGPRMRVRTLHLAAAGVAAAIKNASPREDAARRLADMLNLPVGYIECVRDVILVEITRIRVRDLRPLAVLQNGMIFNNDALDSRQI